jgi:hypothetical protein
VHSVGPCIPAGSRVRAKRSLEDEPTITLQDQATSVVTQLRGKEGGEVLEAEADRAIRIVIRREDNYSSRATGEAMEYFVAHAKGRFGA